MEASNLDQLKAQAQVLIPYYKALVAEIGKERAIEISSKAMNDFYCNIGQQINMFYPGSPIEKISALTPFYATDNALEYQEFKKTPDVYEYKVTACQYAEYYKELGEPELGYLFVCGGDFTIAEGINPDLELTRKQTIMQGAENCDFCYKMK
jgi:hypothetical protein